MGIAILSGMVASLQSSSTGDKIPKWESHTPGTLTPVGPPDGSSVPTRFIACVSREESAKKLRTIFGALGGLGGTVEVVASNNLQAVQQADVVLLWCVHLCHFPSTCTKLAEVVNPS